MPEDKRDPGWNLKAVQKILDQYKDENQNNNNWNWSDHPEKAAELWKQNATFYDSDACRSFGCGISIIKKMKKWAGNGIARYYLDSDCVPGRSSGQDPLWHFTIPRTPFADSLAKFCIPNSSTATMSRRLCTTAFADWVCACSMLFTCSIGFAASPCKRLFEDMMLLFRAQDPMDRARLDQIYMGLNYGIMPDGLSFVTRDQRYQMDPQLLELQLSQLKQLIGEGSQQYTQDIDTGTNKERTAFEVNTLLNQTTRLTGSMLNLAYLQEGFAYNEICRRLTLKDTQDWDAKKLQAI